MKINLRKEGICFYPHSDTDVEAIKNYSDAIYCIDLKKMDSRTLSQNRATFLWATQIAYILNKNKLYMKGIFNNDIEWTKELIHTQVIKGTIKQIFGIDSTTKLTKKQVDSMIDYVTIAFQSKGIEIPPFPNREAWEEKQKGK